MGRASRRKKLGLAAAATQGRWSWGAAILSLLFGLAAIAIAGGLLWTEWKVNHLYIETTGVIVDHRIREERDSRHDGHSYHLQALVRYSVNNLRYHSWADAGIGVAGSGLVGDALELATAAAIPKGSTQPCWYDPEHPEHVVLVRGYTWLAYLLLVPAGLGFIAAGLWCLVRWGWKRSKGEPGA